MNFSNFRYGVCGVYCGQCPSGNGRINDLAADLLRSLAYLTSDYPDYKIQEFNATEFRKGLEWFSESYGCPTCLKIKEPWCEVRKCPKTMKFGSCLLCNNFLACSHTEYHRDRYPFVIDHYHLIHEVGLEAHLKEEELRAKKGISLIDIRKY
ncbi:MAG: DUF3795 domain-containing protein [Candidatus Hodarchaeota archaeon]